MNLDPTLDNAIQQELRGAYQDGYRSGLGAAAYTVDKTCNELRQAGVPEDHLSIAMLKDVARAIRLVSAEINFGGPTP